jgi:hypothetical protein
MFGQVGTQGVRTAEIGGQNTEQSPGSLRRLGECGPIRCGLLHQLAVHFVSEGQVFVTVLDKRLKIRGYVFSMG